MEHDDPPAAGERMIMISFAIGDYVTVRLFDLDYPGRVSEIRLDGGPPYYKVVYARDGEICRDEFQADELEGK